MNSLRLKVSQAEKDIGKLWSAQQCSASIPRVADVMHVYLSVPFDQAKTNTTDLLSPAEPVSQWITFLGLE